MSKLLNSTTVYLIFCILTLIISSYTDASVGTQLLQCSSKELTLVKNGTPSSTIIVSSKASQTELFAAYELQKYFLKISTATVPIIKDTEETKGCKIHIGNTDYVNSSNLDLSEKTLGNDGFIIKTKGNNLILIGRQKRGTLFCVYAFLETLGCRWWAPAFDHYQGNHELIPQQKTITITALNIVEKPKFEIRMDEMEGGSSADIIIEWLPKVRKNTVNPRKLNKENIRQAKTRGLLINRGSHDDFRQHLNPDTYFADHPEWYSYNCDAYQNPGKFPPINMRGLRKVDMPCSSATGGLETLAENYLKTIEANPEIDIFCPWPADGKVYCNCFQCKKLDPNQPSSINSNRKTALNRYLAILYPIIRQMNEKYPQKIIMPMCYASSQEPPQKGVDTKLLRNSNLIMFWCNFHRDWRYPLNVSPDISRLNHFFFDAMKKWLAEGIDVLSEDCYVKGCWASLPVIKTNIILNDLRSVRQIGVKGVSLFNDAPENWYTFEINHYIHSIAAWNPFANIEQILDDYYQKRYRSASQPMKNYFLNIEKAMGTHPNPHQHEWLCGLYPRLFKTRQDYYNRILEYLDICSESIDKAIKLCRDDKILTLIEKNKVTLQYARLDTETKLNMYLYEKTKDSSHIDKAVKNDKQIINMFENTWKDKGILFADSQYNRRIKKRLTDNQQILKQNTSCSQSLQE